MKEPKKEPDNLAAQVPKTFSKLDQLMTDDDNTFNGRAFNPDPMELMPDGTVVSNMPWPVMRQARWMGQELTHLSWPKKT